MFLLRFCHSSDNNTTHTMPKQELSSCSDGRPFGYKRQAEKWGGCCAPFHVGELGPHLTQCHMGRDLPPHQVAPWSI